MSPSKNPLGARLAELQAAIATAKQRVRETSTSTGGGR